MEFKQPLRNISGRVKALAAAQCAASVILIAAYAGAVAQGAALWPLLLFALIMILLASAYYFGLVRPYRHLERMIALFLDGYTLSGISGALKVSLTPASGKLLRRVIEDHDSSYLLSLSKRQAQYRALQNQINPHFLYNTLESIRSEALIAGLTSVADMTEALATFFRYTISKVEDLVSVEEEIQNCETYFRIQQYRFGNRLQLHIQCDEEDKEEIFRCRMPKLTLQPILENSIIHGIELKIGAGNMIVRLERTANRLLIRVSDDGVGMDEQTLTLLNERLGKSSFQLGDDRGGSLALANVNNRIHLIFGEEFGLQVYSMPGLGTDVQIALPVITSDRDIL